MAWLEVDSAVEKPEEVVALFHLSRDFGAKNLPLQGIKCLEAVVGGNFLPQIEAEARANLAAMLMKYTNNLREAKAHLEHALRTVENLPVALSFVCRVISLLGTCLGQLNSAVQQKQVLLKGLNLVRQDRLQFEGATEREKIGWYVAFHASLVQVLVSEGDKVSALATAQSARKELAERAGLAVRLQINLTVLQLLLLSQDYEGARECIDVCTSLGERCATKESVELGSYLCLLRALYELRIGNVGDLQDSLAQAKNLVLKMKSGEVEAKLLPPDFLHSLLLLLESVCLRMSGHYSEERDVSEEARKKIENEWILVNSAHTNETFKSTYILLKYLVLESQIISALTQCKIQEAASLITAAIELIDAYPQTLGGVESSVHLMIGSVNMLCGDFDHAEDHLKLALASSRDQYQASLAKLQLCFCSLENESITSAEAEESFQRFSVSFEKRDRAYPAHLLCQVALALMRSDIGGAKAMVREALQSAHAKGDHQVIVLCLVEFGKITALEGDTTQTKESIDAAKSLAANLSHLPSLIQALAFSDQILKKETILSPILYKWGKKVMNARVKDKIQNWRTQAVH